MSTISGNECWYFIDLNLNHTFFDETKKEIHQMWGSRNRLKPLIQNVLVNWIQRESDDFLFSSGCMIQAKLKSIWFIPIFRMHLPSRISRLKSRMNNFKTTEACYTSEFFLGSTHLVASVVDGEQ